MKLTSRTIVGAVIDAPVAEIVAIAGPPHLSAQRVLLSGHRDRHVLADGALVAVAVGVVLLAVTDRSTVAIPGRARQLAAHPAARPAAPADARRSVAASRARLARRSVVAGSGRSFLRSALAGAPGAGGASGGTVAILQLVLGSAASFGLAILALAGPRFGFAVGRRHFVIQFCVFNGPVECVECVVLLMKKMSQWDPTFEPIHLRGIIPKNHRNKKLN